MMQLHTYTRTYKYLLIKRTINRYQPRLKATHVTGIRYIFLRALQSHFTI